MQSIDHIRDNLKKSRARVEEMREHCTVFPTPNGGAHTPWTLGHLAYIETLVIHTFMLGEPNPLAAWEETFDSRSRQGECGGTRGLRGCLRHLPPLPAVRRRPLVHASRAAGRCAPGRRTGSNRAARSRAARPTLLRSTP